MVIGGEQIYRLTLPVATDSTSLKSGEVEGDAFFPTMIRAMASGE